MKRAKGLVMFVRYKAVVLAFFPLSAIFLALTHSGLINIQPGPSDGKDTPVTWGTGTEFRATHNYGGEDGEDGVAVGQIGSSGQAHRALIEFNLPSHPSGQVVQSGRVGLTVTHADRSSQIGISRMIQPRVAGTGQDQPTGDGATWQTYDGGHPCPGIVGFRSLDGGGLNVTASEFNNPVASGILNGSGSGAQSRFELDPLMVQQWLDGNLANEGLLIRSVNELLSFSSEIIASSENVNTLCPTRFCA
jgi:hypothetical protein